MNAIKQIFNPSTYAALRNVLSALGILMGMLGVVALSPQQIDKIISVAQQLGTTIAAIMAFVGLMTPLITAVIAALKSTQRSNIERTNDIAKDPTQPQSTEAAKALVSATASIAQNIKPLAEDAKQALIAATISQPSVQTIITDAETAKAAPSESVVAIDDHAADSVAASKAVPLFNP